MYILNWELLNPNEKFSFCQFLEINLLSFLTPAVPLIQNVSQNIACPIWHFFFDFLIFQLHLLFFFHCKINRYIFQPNICPALSNWHQFTFLHNKNLQMFEISKYSFLVYNLTPSNNAHWVIKYYDSKLPVSFP